MKKTPPQPGDSSPGDPPLPQSRSTNHDALEDRVRELEAAGAQTQQELTDSEQRFRELADLLPGMLFEHDTEGRITYANQNILDVTGYTAEDLERGLMALDVVAPQDREQAAEGIARLLAGEGLVSLEQHLLPSALYQRRLADVG